MRLGGILRLQVRPSSGTVPALGGFMLSFKTAFRLIFMSGLAGVSAVSAADHAVHAGGDIQGAINAAVSGDTVTLDAGVTYNVANVLNLPAHSPCSGAPGDSITIQSSAQSAIAVPSHPRSPMGSTAYSDMAKIVTSDTS